MSELKKCRFCGSTPILNHERFHIGSNIECQNPECLLNNTHKANYDLWQSEDTPYEKLLEYVKKIAIQVLNQKDCDKYDIDDYWELDHKEGYECAVSDARLVLAEIGETP